MFPYFSRQNRHRRNNIPIRRSIYRESIDILLKDSQNQSSFMNNTMTMSIFQQINDKDILATDKHQPQSISSLVRRIITFFQADIWRIRLADLPRKKALLIRLTRMILLSFRGFKEDRCQLRASALTYYSLLSIVPVVAMIFGIAKGFGFEETLQAQILERFPGQEEVFSRVFTFAKAMLENTQGGMIAGIGIVVLFWSVINLLSHIERSFNRIWHVKKSSSFGRKFADYLAFMLLSPVLFFLSSSTTVYITTQITHITQQVSLVGTFSPIIFFFLKLTPYGLIWILFSMVYMLMPNTRVRFSSGIWGGRCGRYDLPAGPMGVHCVPSGYCQE